MPPEFKTQFENPTGSFSPVEKRAGKKSNDFLITLVAIMLISGAYAIWFFYNLPSDFEPEYAATPRSARRAVATEIATSTVDMTDWKTYRNDEYGFEIKYPASFVAEVPEKIESNYDSKLVFRIVNPERAGKIDTDLPIEQIILSFQNDGCEYRESSWEEGFGLIYYRTTCIERAKDWPIAVNLSAFDKDAQVIMDAILSTFKFTK